MSDWGPIAAEGRWVLLEPLTQDHVSGLFLAAQDEEIWRFMPVHQPRTEEEMRGLVTIALELQAKGLRFPHAIVEKATGRIIGSTSYLDPSEKDLHIEIGWTWLARDYWRTPINTECKYLLLRHAFEELDCIRVQLKTDLRNERSQRAIERIGGVREGVLRKVIIIKEGYQRSTVYYSILDDEWSLVKAELERRMAGAD